jgi:hypothetical protein
MRKILHKLIRYSRDGVNLSADLNAVVSTGEEGVSSTSVRSRNRIVQRNGRTWTESEAEVPTETETKRDEGTD